MPKYAENEVEELKSQAVAGLEHRLKSILHATSVEKYFERLNFELGVIENMSYFETNTGDKFNIFGQGGGDALAEQFALPMLGKIPISEDTNDIADDGTPLILQEKNTPTKTEIEKLVSAIAEKLPPIVDETCTGRLAKVFEELAK